MNADFVGSRIDCPFTFEYVNNRFNVKNKKMRGSV